MKPSPDEQTSDRIASPERSRKGFFVGSTVADDSSGAKDNSRLSMPSKRKKKQGRRRFSRRLVFAVIALVISGGVLYWIITGTTRGPAFYQTALEQSPEEAYANGEAFEQSLAQWHNELHANGGWRLVLDDEQLNGWLGAHLPEKFPDSLPAEITNPRCSISANESKLAFQFHWKSWVFVVTTSIEFFLTDETNVLGAKLRGVRSGVVPLPISKWMGSAANSAAGAGVKVRWTQEDGSPLALITIPDKVPGNSDLRLVLSGVEQQTGQLILTGYTEPRELEPNEGEPQAEPNDLDQ